MSLNRLFYPLWFYADVSLRHGGGAVLQKALHKGDVIAIIAVDLCRIPFAEAVGADPLIAQVITDASKDLLHFPCRDGEDQIEMLDAVAQAVILNVLLDYERDGKHSRFSCLLLHDGPPEPSAIVHNIAGAELHDVADPQAKVAFQHKSRRHSFIRAKETAALAGCS